jgi:cyclophilin family peptidyl-prolyl cis-trans isomerase
MPKTNKRAETRRAAKIAKAHATKLPESQVKETERQRSASYKAPARGIARYPWAITIVLLLIATGIIAAYVNHVGPFAQPKPKPHPTASQLQATASAQAQATASAQARAAASAAAKPSATTAVNAAGSPCVQSSILSQITNTSAVPSASDIQKITHTYSKEPTMSIDQQKVYCAGFNTNRGLIILELDPSQAPHTVNNFVFLAQHHFYDGLKFHRVLPGSIIQGGDPKGDGSGGPGYSINDEPVKGNYTAGTIAMAKTSAPNSAGSQFFINLADNTTTFPKDYTIFGHVVQGLDVAQKIQGPGDDPSTKNITPDVMNHVVVVQAP